MNIEKLCILMAISNCESNEYIISSYFLKNWQRIVELKMNDVLKEIGVSKSTLTRFCQSLGYKNYTELQYELFFEMSSMQKYKNKKDDDEEYIEKVKGKKRIIVLGDGLSLSPLVGYKSLFERIGISFEIKLNYINIIDLLDYYQIDENDFIIYVSMYHNNLELLMNEFNNYIDFLNYMERYKKDFIYIGKVANNKEKDVYSIAIKNGLSKSEEIYALCEFFEKIYYYLLNNERKV